MQKISTAAYSNTKPHYLILDGLRGVAALMVIWYHIFEGYATSPFDQKFNHGYLAVDFFFILSGFVIGYAYDDRWKKITTWDFFKRRLIRLQPMIILGALFGAVAFCLQGSVQWDGTKISLSMVMLATLLTMFLIPVAPGAGGEVRGNGEMFPLNGPSWSLFFEYIGYVLYALIIRRLSTKALTVLVALAGIGLATFSFLNLSGFGNMGVGWSMGGYGYIGGFLRLLFSFSMGLLLSRKFKPVKIKGAFWICALSVIILMSIPYVGGQSAMWMNCLYDSLCILFIFPVLVCIGASGQIKDNKDAKIYTFLGDLSYPLYIIHYPLMYLFYSWLWTNKLTFEQTWPIAIAMFFGCIALGYLSLKLYDEPVRRWLSKKFLAK
ncbi:MAG: acyltransferase family protein [Bacteroidales bacterium]